MTRQNLYTDVPWDREWPEGGIRYRTFWRPEGARMGATLHDLAPGAAGGRLHMHFGAEEMFFVVSGRPDPQDSARRRGAVAGRLRLLPRGPCRAAHVQQSDR